MDAAAAGSGHPAGSQRLHWIDWLRVGAIGGIFVFHSLRPFSSEGWHVTNAQTSELLTTVTAFFWTFGLAVLFLLAGVGARFALRKRTWREFLAERTARLLVPFVVGTLLLAPFQALIEGTHEGTFDGPLAAFPGWWIASLGWAADSGFSPSVFGVGYHLWFLGFLFAFSVIALPLCAWLMGRRGTDAIAALAGRVAAVPGATLGFALPIGVLLVAGVPLGSDEHDWAEFLWYFGYFLTGFVLLSDERFIPAVRRDGPIALVVALATTAALIGLGIAEWLVSAADRGLDWRFAPAAGVFALEGWAWTVVILNIGIRVAGLQRPVSPRLGDAVLPVYVIHQPVILAVAFFVVQWPLGILPKWLAVLGISAVVTLALVELALRIPVARVLLGARPRPAAPVAAAPARRAVDEPPIAPSAKTRHARPR
jgi:peptidoglycan/LPS O-acetylase OafA/YrhL